jgi:hypothetical protein
LDLCCRLTVRPRKFLKELDGACQEDAFIASDTPIYEQRLPSLLASLLNLDRSQNIITFEKDVRVRGVLSHSPKCAERCHAIFVTTSIEEPSGRFGQKKSQCADDKAKHDLESQRKAPTYTSRKVSKAVVDLHKISNSVRSPLVCAYPVGHHDAENQARQSDRNVIASVPSARAFGHEDGRCRCEQSNSDAGNDSPDNELRDAISRCLV